MVRKKKEFQPFVNRIGLSLVLANLAKLEVEIQQGMEELGALLK
ncbi:hypothetical protein [Nostoc sp. CHAB 5836]|nr:hypothetical protein [Nostoc sp. CHAB 5836]